MCCYLCDDLASLFSPWLVKLADNGSPYRLLLSWKASSILNHYNLPIFFTFPNHWAVTPRPCLWKHKIDALTLSTWGSSPVPRLPGFCIKSASARCEFLRFLCLSICLSERLLGLLLHDNILLVFVPSVPFSQQVITNRRLTSHSVQLDSLCWHGQGWFWEGAGWQQLDSTHYGVKGKTETAKGRKYVLPLPASLAVSTCVIFSFIVPYIQQSKNGFVTLQIYQMRSVSTFQRCTIWLPCGLHNTLMLCMTDYWIYDTLQWKTAESSFGPWELGSP